MSRARQLTDDENNAMRILWDRGGASASELAIAMTDTRRMSHGTALNLLRRLSAKGAVARHRSGSLVVYKPRLNRETARTHALGRLLCETPANDGSNLGVVVLRDSDFEPADLAALKAERAEKAAKKANR